MCSENSENFSWDLDDRGDYRVIEDDKEQQFLSSQKSQGKLTRGSHLNSRIDHNMKQFQCSQKSAQPSMLCRCKTTSETH